jgi:hypothetical protein
MNPKTPENAPKIKYNVPIFLWFVENNHLTTHGFVKKATKGCGNIIFKPVKSFHIKLKATKSLINKLSGKQLS